MFLPWQPREQVLLLETARKNTPSKLLSGQKEVEANRCP